MKIPIGITLEEDEVQLARRLATARGLTSRGGYLGPDVRGNVAALFRQLLHEESDRVVADRIEQDRASVGGRK
jgi:hypothetical protein